MRLAFTKMHGLGNDFVVFDGVRQRVELSAPQLRFLADRHFGIGCDQILLIEPSVQPNVDFRYRIFNADGGEVEQCGNGARCFARFVRDHGLSTKDLLTVQTNSGLIQLQLQPDGQVSVNMGIPEFTPAKIPFTAEQAAIDYPLEWEGQTYRVGVVSLGNPHLLLRVENIDTAPVQSLGAALERHPRFPKRVNVGFMQVLTPQTFKLRVFERGVGETLACGSGACAAMVIGHRWKLFDPCVHAQLRGGTLIIRWSGPDTEVVMTGPAQTVFEGSLEL
ncbi:MAG: diaminopimelate epimerase [Gammaproteobacteria bacterium]|nr:diaminopimelate epimerase [Gammaproteobacteria bacterium]